MKCPKCGRPARSLGTMQITTKGGYTVQAEVFQCGTCRQKVPRPEEGTEQPIKFARVQGKTEILPPSASEFS